MSANPYRSALASILPYAKRELEHGDMEGPERVALQHDIDAASALLSAPPPDSAAILSAFGVGRAVQEAVMWADKAAMDQLYGREGLGALVFARSALLHANDHMQALPEPGRAALTPHVARMRGKVAESFARAGVQL